MKRIVRLEISHCRECPFSRRGRPIPFAEFTTATICGQTNKECYWDYSEDNNKAEFFPSHCPFRRLMRKKDSARRIDVRVKFVGNDLYLAVAKNSQLEFSAIGKHGGMDSLTISNGDLVIRDLR